jgi:hypothetical protein
MDLNAPCRLVRQERQFAGGCVSAASRKLVHRRDKLAGVHLRIRNQCYSALVAHPLAVRRHGRTQARGGVLQSAFNAAYNSAMRGHSAPAARAARSGFPKMASTSIGRPAS